MSLIDRTVVSPAGIWSYPDRRLTNIVFKRHTFTDPTTRSTNSTSFVEYNRFTITAPPNGLLWILGVSFTRETYASGGTAESALLFNDNPIVGIGSSSGATYVLIRTYAWAGFIVEPDASVTIRIMYRNSVGTYTIYMRNVRVEVLYVEVEVS